ncbi:MAG: cytochrome b/b6 domain-containing protein [Pseudomonadota bacterium]|nr:cytochrome b/b6 domain-containing protein [Pseudomonadota bacterium]MEE3098522.1 cytochrome b/b6 domain-containing protein [Pseudomonadota bacterium]
MSQASHSRPASAHPAPAAYSPMQKRLHWAVVGVLILQYLAFDGMGRPFHQGMEAGAMSYGFTPVAHIALGFAVLALAGWRLALRVRLGAPEAPAEEPALARTASRWGHGALYALLVALPVTGLIGWFGMSEDFAGVHEVLTNLLLAVAGLHVAAALVHQFWWKTDLMSRMR